MNVNHHSKEPTQAQQQCREINRGGVRRERKRKKSYLHLINKVTQNIFNLVYLEYSVLHNHDLVCFIRIASFRDNELHSLQTICQYRWSLSSPYYSRCSAFTTCYLNQQ